MSSNTVIQGCGTHHIAIQTHDWDASLKLYRDVLGMTEAASFSGGDAQKIVLLDTGDGSHIELFGPSAGAAQTGEGANPILHFALSTTDARAATEHVRQAGYKVTVEPKELDLGGLEVTIAFFKGPSGEVVEFFEVRS